MRRWKYWHPYISLTCNAVYAVGNVVLGMLARSWWSITVGIYYTVLALARFWVLWLRHRTGEDSASEWLVKRVTGVLLVVLSFCITGITVLAIREGRGTAFHEIVMIAIATYAFTKITVSVVEMVRARGSASPFVKTLRNLSLANACVSVYSMQRSMLVSFPGMATTQIQLLNIVTGIAVWMVVLLLGINLIGGKYTTMAKSKMVKTVGKMADTVTDGYKKIEKGVVDGYKKIEKGVVDGYTKLEDKFVDAYLTKEGETVAEAKARLKKKE